ncbi:MAG: polysaccharide biosynthesis protein [Pirellulales bacterium]|nr:polysaccharide biosynthesis protein [Pirellulales bacterium]
MNFISQTGYNGRSRQPLGEAPEVPLSAGEPSWKELFHRQLEPMRIGRFWLLAVLHVVLFTAIYYLAFVVRFDGTITEIGMQVYWKTLPWVLLLKLVIFYLSGHYHGWWRYVTFADLAALLRASFFSFCAIAVMNYFAKFTPDNIPRGVVLLDFLLGIAVIGGLRASWRLFSEQFMPFFDRGNCRNALLVGVDHNSALLAHQIQAHTQLHYRIRGFIATSSDVRHGTRMGRIPVLGGLDEVRTIVAATAATDILVTAGILSGPQMRELMEASQQLGLRLKIIPPVEDLFDGDHRIPIRDIEINDLLRRDPVQLDAEIIRDLLEGRVVMVTGAGGSIGSEICRQVMNFNPKAMILVGNGENPIFHVERELRAAYPGSVFHCRIGSVVDFPRMRQIFQEFKPEVVFHAAAHKHVPMMEVNVGEAIKNNVLGTKCLVDLADEFGARNFVFISTDKAVHPSSVMGTTKHISERYVYATSQESATRFTVVRFGNVLGSNGSVVPIFQDQIRGGGPITVTDPRMTRFFMTIPEASQLVLQAAAMGEGGEIFVLEMGESVRIVDLAKDLIRLSGLPEHAIEVAFTGVRPGEKLFEELYFEDEETLPTKHPKLRAAYHRPYSLAEVQQAIAELQILLHESPDKLRKKLMEIVPEYTPPNWGVKANAESINHSTDTIGSTLLGGSAAIRHNEV